MFRDVDADERVQLVAMMDATDAWPAVRAARAWALERSAVGPGDLVLDVGCGPGTFGALARGAGATTVDLDRSAAMLDVRALRHPAGSAAFAAVEHLPVRDGAATLVHVERVLQWTPDPASALAELHRVTSGDGLLAVTDTDWGTLAVDHPDPSVGARLVDAALGWVTHPVLARGLVRRLRDAGFAAVEARADTIVLTRWDPDDPAQRDGPPGLPLRLITAGARRADRRAADAAVAAVADRARAGEFFATLTLVSVLGRGRAS